MLGCSTNNEETLPRVLFSGFVEPRVQETGFSNAQGGDVVLKILVGVGLGFFLFSNPDARQVIADVMRATADALAPAKKDQTLQERISDAIKEPTLETQGKTSHQY